MMIFRGTPFSGSISQLTVRHTQLSFAAIVLDGQNAQLLQTDRMDCADILLLEYAMSPVSVDQGLQFLRHSHLRLLSLLHHLDQLLH